MPFNDGTGSSGLNVLSIRQATMHDGIMLNCSWAPEGPGCGRRCLAAAPAAQLQPGLRSVLSPQTDAFPPLLPRRTLLLKLDEERKKLLEAISATFGHLGAGVSDLLADKAKLGTAVTGLTLLALGVYSTREGVRVAGNTFDRWFGTPNLVRRRTLGPGPRNRLLVVPPGPAEVALARVFLAAVCRADVTAGIILELCLAS